MSINHEYRVDVKIRNNLFIERIEGAGYKTIGEFCRINKISQSRINEIIAMKLSPLMSNGKFRFHIIKTADVLGCSPEDLFTDTQMSMAIKNNKYCLKVNEAEVKCMIDQNNQPLLLEDHVFEDQKNKLLKKALETLPIREKKILSLRFGLDDGKEHTYQDISDEFGCSRENIRRIESQALRRLRHPSRSDQLQDLI